MKKKHKRKSNNNNKKNHKGKNNMEISKLKPACSWVIHSGTGPCPVSASFPFVRTLGNMAVLASLNKPA